MEFTKGEWKAKGTKFGHWEVYTELPNRVDVACAYLTQIEPETNGNAKANARLIAQAPRMYTLLEYLASNGWNAGVTEEAREILAKIEGGG